MGQSAWGIGTELICLKALRCSQPHTPHVDLVPLYEIIKNIYIKKKKKKSPVEDLASLEDLALHALLELLLNIKGSCGRD